MNPAWTCREPCVILLWTLREPYVFGIFRLLLTFFTFRINLDSHFNHLKCHKIIKWCCCYWRRWFLCLLPYHRTKLIMSHNLNMKTLFSPTLFQFSICSDYFSKVDELTNYFKTIHSEVKKFQCFACDASFSSKDTLTKHTKTVHSDVNKFQCFACNASFSRKDKPETWHTYKTIHSEVKKFHCSACDASFSWKNSLNIHTKTIHCDTK